MSAPSIVNTPYPQKSPRFQRNVTIVFCAVMVMALIGAIGVPLWAAAELSKPTYDEGYQMGYCEGYLEAVSMTTNSPRKGGDPVEAGICPTGWDD